MPKKTVVLSVKDKTMKEGWGSEFTPFYPFPSSLNRKTDKVRPRAIDGVT
jgi:hypothetical protein